ncbi:MULTISPECIES: NCS2 family permease [Metabacillus]|jgi:AGZA family xanthine/uracil permease-like MFS transporter|uniref:NCS2 family permease n=1 Tax=Metabacillus hrfriensis TaxID=3048891 RepID=A0ACD4RCI5_9BACI|nr:MULTISPECIES: NCS2 family permease [Metabacillus]UAL52594.1 NCS2 family permease [Metabacillus dongyingensis]UOK58275.1 NCS2 family permease [Bacillus sp. OVS6]USK28911.1 NCS2 family permease [Bacillus sp. CMF21]WHZ58128.1 NCS2 family permease [Metabacillus sp. CT-WN-B3]
MKKYFQFEELGTNYRREIIGGLTTFLSMAYILFVNPLTLSLASVPDFPNELRMDQGAVFTATALAAAIGSLLMGLIARYPIALAPGMGLNAFFAFTVVLTMGIPWQTALSGVLVSGLIFIVLTTSGLREKIINSIPEELKHAVGAGIGLFITFVGFQNAGIITNNDAVLVGLGNLKDGNALLAIFGVFITVIFMVKRINGGIFYGMILTAIMGMIFQLIDVPTQVVGAVPSLEPTFGAAFQNLDQLLTLQMLVVILTFLFADFFDTAGTLVAVANQAGLIKENKLPRASKALFADSAATVIGSILGTSTTTSYIESSAGVAAGARTGFASVVTAALFLLALFFSPLLSVITAPVTAPALIIVGILMVSSLGKIDWNRFEMAVPAFLTIIAMPLTYSIATGIAIGFIFYPVTMIVKGKAKEIHPIMYGLFVIFILYFVFLAG